MKSQGLNESLLSSVLLATAVEGPSVCAADVPSLWFRSIAMSPLIPLPCRKLPLRPLRQTLIL